MNYPSAYFKTIIDSNQSTPKVYMHFCSAFFSSVHQNKTIKYGAKVTHTHIQTHKITAINCL